MNYKKFAEMQRRYDLENFGLYVKNEIIEYVMFETPYTNFNKNNVVCKVSNNASRLTVYIDNFVLYQFNVDEGDLYRINCGTMLDLDILKHRIDVVMSMSREEEEIVSHDS